MQNVAKSVFNCIVMGPPGSGKGTVASRIIRDFAMEHISCGDQLRSHIRHQTYLGNEAQKYISHGNLVPDDLVSRMMLTVLQQACDTDGRLLDGFPRTRTQAEFLHERFPVDAVIELNVPHEVIIDRVRDRWIHEPSGRIYNLKFNPPTVPGKDDLTGEDLVQRLDDDPETVAQRLRNYETWERPVAAFYDEHKLLNTFTGTETNALWPHIYDFLRHRLKPKDATASG